MRSSSMALLRRRHPDLDRYRHQIQPQSGIFQPVDTRIKEGQRISTEEKSVGLVFEHFTLSLLPQRHARLFVDLGARRFDQTVKFRVAIVDEIVTAFHRLTGME